MYKALTANPVVTFVLSLLQGQSKSYTVHNLQSKTATNSLAQDMMMIDTFKWM